jgi:acetoacetate decarboxylase
VAELRGFMPPRSPQGRASIVPPPPWHYSGEVLTIEYRTDPAAVAALLPDPLEPADEDPGAVAFVFADWQS